MNTGRKRLVLGSRRAVTVVAAATTLVMPTGLMTAPPALAEPPNSRRPKIVDHEEPVPGHEVKVRPRKPSKAQSGPAAKADWPDAGSAEVEVPSDAKAAVRAGELPVQVLSPGKRSRSAGTVPAADRVRVQVLDRRASRAAGVDGLAFTVARTDTAAASGRVKVKLDYSKFAQAFGGAYGARLRLTRLPQCALTTPAKPECRTGEPVPASNDPVARTLTAEVEAAPAAGSGSPAVATAGQGATLLVAAADSDSSQGDYKATSLKASAAWQAGGNSGDFTWSYPMRVPPVPGELTPKVAISYSSASVDGRTANTNGQPSWVGEGFDLWPGYIERRYKACEDDGAPKDEWGNSPGDLCWGYDNATVTWNGKAGELIQKSDGTWRVKNDDGTKFEKLTSSSIHNGDNNGEYWKVTTTDGIQYFFGLNRLPGWTSGKPETNSAWTVPVFGNDAGEPCHDSSFAGSWCQQAYRWNLDYVVDPAGNAVNYTYAQETNHYGRNLKPKDETSYVRGGYLKTISYGLRKDALFATAPAQVTFTTSERCIPGDGFDCDPSKIGDNPDKWWDVPWDLHCNSGQECKEDHGAIAPTFWSRKRLTKVTTQIRQADGSGYRPVDSWSLNHTWGLADVERDLLLHDIQHTGHAADATTTTLPKVSFNHIQLPNRLDKTGDDILPYIRYRLGAIYDESGGQIDIAYSNTDCSLSDLPDPESNTTRCMPVIWTPPGREDPITDWFHKYVVTSVIQTDRTGLAPDMVTEYEYLGGAAWHFDDDDGLTKKKKKTWSQWRGYGHVRTLTGDGYDPATQEDAYFLRGMDGDRKNKSGGTKSVTVSDGEGGSHTDHNALNGFALKTVQYTEPGGSVHAKTVNTPWRVQTASRTRSWGTVTANVVRTDTSRTWTAKDGGGWIETKTDTDYADDADEPGVGRVTSVNDLGDTSINSDDKCTRTTYADNTGAWMVSFPSRVETVAVACTATPDRPEQVVSDVRTHYDGGGFGAAPSKGLDTKVEEAADYDGDTPRYVTKSGTVYDSYGRATKVTDALGQATTTTYTDTHGLTTKKQVTTPPATPGETSTALTTVEELDPAWGQAVRVTDANGGRTDLVHDGLGRLLQVWLPNRDKGSHPYPNYEFGYQVAEGQIVAVTTKALNAGGGQRIEQIELLDGWLRPRQTQVPAPEGRLVSDTFYDDRGQVVKTYAPYPVTGAPEPALFGVGTPGKVETQTRTSYDGLGRTTVEKLTTGNGSQPDQELWRTTYDYGGGNRVSVTPPDGGTPTAEITNARGQVIERRQYKADTPTGDYDATTYTYTPAGEIASVTDPSGNVFTATYDLRGRKTKTTDPDKGATTFTYDDLDRVTSTTDARGEKVVTTYDGMGRKTATRKNTADGPLLTSFSYDTAVDGKGKLAAATRHHNGAQYTNRIMGYDELGRVAAARIQIPSQQGPLAGNYQFTTTYNLDGTAQSTSMSGAGGLPYETLTHSYDQWLRPTRLASSKATYINDTLYTKTGKPTLLEFGAAPNRVWQSFDYQFGTQRLEQTRTKREGATGDYRDAAYHYTDSGTITAITDTSRDGVDNQCFTYDHLQRLTHAWAQGTTDACAATPSDAVIGGPAPYWHSYTYDTAGNRTAETQHGVGGAADTTRTYTYAEPGQGNRLTQLTQTGPNGDRTDTYTYDATGNTTAINTSTGGPATSTQTYEWDTEGELAKVTENGNDTTFINDADGNRLIRQDPTGTTLYLPGGTELRALSGSSTATGTRYYTFAGQTVAMRTSDGSLTYLTGDHQGTAQIAVNATTQAATVRRFTPFGSIRGLDEHATWPNDKGFLGGTQDPTGLTHLGAREYSPDNGRFISVDPIMDLADPQQMNGYTYANNSPVTNADPSGALHVGAGGGANYPRKPGCNSGSYACHGVSHWNGDSSYDNYPVYRRHYHYTRAKARAARRIGTSGITVPQHLEPKRFRKIYNNIYNKMTSGLDLKDAGYRYSVELHAALNTCREIDECLHSRAYLDFLSAHAILNAGAFVGGSARRGPRNKAAARAQVTASQRRLGICNSFVPGTTVLMADGTRKPIEDLKVGDKVIATDPDTGRTTAEPVQATITTKGDKKLVRITIDTDAPARFRTAGNKPQHTTATTASTKLSGNGIVVATDNHPFWVAGDINTWVPAADLEPGMWLRTSAGTYTQITAVKAWTTHHQRVHNLSVANTHTFHVLAGPTSVLVHNDSCGNGNGTGNGNGQQQPRINTDKIDEAIAKRNSELGHGTPRQGTWHTETSMRMDEHPAVRGGPNEFGPTPATRWQAVKFRVTYIIRLITYAIGSG